MSKQKNIVFINPGQFGYKAGYYYYCKYLANDENFNISFVCFDQNLSKLEIPDVKVKYVDFSGHTIIRYFRWLKTVFKAMQQDKKKDTIFFMVYFKLCFIFTLLFPKKLKVLDIRTGSISNNSVVNWLQNQQYRFESMFFKHITILSKGLIKHIGINPRKCHWLPLGSEVLSTTNKNFNELKLIYIGSLNNRRIYETIEGLKIFIDQFPINIKKISYDIFGFGSKKELETLKQKINSTGLTKIINYHGRKNHTELKPFFDQCNIGVAYVPQTRYYEYQPATKTFEYILSGMACIATNTYENRILITNENGVICDDNKESFAEALTTVVVNQHVFDSKKIRNSLSDFTWKNIVNNNLKLFLNNICE